LGNVSSTVPTDFVLTLYNGGQGTVTVNSIAFSDPQWTTSDTVPFDVTDTSVTLNLVYTPSGVLGAQTVVITFDNTGSNSQTKYTVNANAVDPYAGGIVKISSLDPNLPVGQFPTTLLSSTSTIQVGVENVGSSAFTISAATITAGGTLFVLTPAVTLPVTINPGDPIVYFPLLFTPTDVGLANGTLEFTTDLVAPQHLVDVTLAVFVVPFIAVSVLDNSSRVIFFGFDSGSLKFIETNDYNYSDQDSALEFNGALWERPGYENTIERIEVYYENIGVCTGLTATLTILRPSIGPDVMDIVTQTISIGTASADGTDRTAYFDLTASGEIMRLSLTRIKASGPCSITAIRPCFADRGEKVENV
jgi:hypothetical protein